MSAALKRPDLDADLLYVARDRPKAAFPELSRVALLAPTMTDTNATVAAGTVGTVVFVYDDGTAYEVEFPEPMGSLATVDARDLRLLP